MIDKSCNMNTTESEAPTLANSSKPVSDVWKARLLLVGVGLLSLIPCICQKLLTGSHVYEIRFSHGLHPSDLLSLSWIGYLSIYFPIGIVIALVISVVRPPWTWPMVAFATAYFLLYVVLFLFCTTTVIVIHVPT
jgi:hypothetical protein